jgi:hypothetical protein
MLWLRVRQQVGLEGAGLMPASRGNRYSRARLVDPLGNVKALWT